ncbi:MAG: T9SS type A sorting domain-containing protein, partial [Bacteroidota bacterium]|nr:T9SS type A sorting domain-containing protein [Bacteroidota bacterium]
DSASVSWDKSFNLAYVSGQGTISYKVKSSGGILPTVATASGEDLSMMAPMAIESTGSSGWIRATISNSCGDIPLEKTVWAGLPGFIPVVSGYPTVTCGNSLFTEANNRTVTWSVGGPLQIVGSNYGYKCVVRGTGSGVGWVYATAANDCGSFRGELLVEISCGYSLSFSPNPSSGETTIEIATGSGEVLAPDTEWDLEVYDSMQSLKTKTQKLKGDKKAINTTGWKDGVYIVRVKIGKEIISEKLVVKH